MRWSLLLLVACLSAVASGEEPVEDLGVRQQDEAAMQWFRDAKFGMFLHWGLYAVPARGEWYMEQSAVTPAEYRKLAFDQGDGNYFDAAAYDPRQWAELAKAAGMKYVVLTARHHDGFALFDSKHPNAFTSVQSLNRDLFREYVDAMRKAGLRVGVYYSPLSWRYPGYYDVTGTRAARNRWNYRTDPAHKENARLMKEEVYEQVRTLLAIYGPFDYVFWDGGWLAQSGSDRDAAFFWEPGRYRKPENAWPVAKEFGDLDEAGRPLGLMGLVRKYSPKAIANSRSGWIGDLAVREGVAADRGPIAAGRPWERCMNFNNASWGYHTRQECLTYEQLVDAFVNILVRDGNLLLNFGPDRHGRIPDEHAEVVRRMGLWLAKVGDSVYGTRAGPWQPVDGKYGFTTRPGKIFVHLLAGYEGTEFATPAIDRPVVACRDLYRDRPLEIEQRPDGTAVIRGIDRAAHRCDTVVAIKVKID
ncbi:MAG: alpha-L-fucosidase [Pirellulales bacterium]